MCTCMYVCMCRSVVYVCMFVVYVYYVCIYYVLCVCVRAYACMLSIVPSF